MANCIICGDETLKDRKTCIGCVGLKAVAKQGDNVSGTKMANAVKKFESNPDLVQDIDFTAFSRRKASL